MPDLQLLKVFDQWKNIAFLRPAEVSRAFLQKYTGIKGIVMHSSLGLGLIALHAKLGTSFVTSRCAKVLKPKHLHTLFAGGP